MKIFVRKKRKIYIFLKKRTEKIQLKFKVKYFFIYKKRFGIFQYLPYFNGEKSRTTDIKEIFMSCF